jgi:replicative superfamily II helicase
VNRLLEEELYGEVEFVIIDELHMIMDESRGYLLESLVAKLRYIEKVKGTRVQIVALSATMGGIDKL